MTKKRMSERKSLFLSSVQKELLHERRALKDFIEGVPEERLRVIFRNCSIKVLFNGRERDGAPTTCLCVIVP